MGGQTYSIGTDYDPTGQVCRLTYPDGTEVDRTYSERGQLATIAFNGTTIDTRTYDDGGRMLTSSYNNGVSESRTYNIDNTLGSIIFAGWRQAKRSWNVQLLRAKEHGRRGALMGTQVIEDARIREHSAQANHWRSGIGNSNTEGNNRPQFAPTNANLSG